jgi:outer membrane receptor protein involved in Fe transport
LSENYDSFPSGTQNFNDFDVRMDWAATSKDNVFVRYSYGQDVLTKGSQYPNLPAGYGTGVNPVHPRGEAVGETHQFSSNMVNEFRYGHLYDFFGYVPPLDNIPVSANLGILNANRSSLLGGGAAINGGWPEGTYTGDGGPYTVPQSSNQFVDAISWVKGRHTIKFGASIEKRQVSFFQGNNAKGNFDFSENSFTGNSTSDMLASFVTNYSIGVASSYFVTQNWETGYYFQDDWKVNRRLTLNLGLRYDLYTFPLETHNYQSNFNLSTLTLQQAGTNGLSANIVATNRNNFAPRFGFAYDLFGDGKTSVRGGYGIYYFLDPAAWETNCRIIRISTAQRAIALRLRKAAGGWTSPVQRLPAPLSTKTETPFRVPATRPFRLHKGRFRCRSSAPRSIAPIPLTQV